MELTEDLSRAVHEMPKWGWWALALGAGVLILIHFRNKAAAGSVTGGQQLVPVAAVPASGGAAGSGGTATGDPGTASADAIAAAIQNQSDILGQIVAGQAAQSAAEQGLFGQQQQAEQQMFGALSQQMTQQQQDWQQALSQMLSQVAAAGAGHPAVDSPATTSTGYVQPSNLPSQVSGFPEVASGPASNSYLNAYQGTPPTGAIGYNPNQVAIGGPTGGLTQDQYNGLYGVSSPSSVAGQVASQYSGGLPQINAPQNFVLGLGQPATPSGSTGEGVTPSYGEGVRSTGGTLTVMPPPAGYEQTQLGGAGSQRGGVGRLRAS